MRGRGRKIERCCLFPSYIFIPLFCENKQQQEAHYSFIPLQLPWTVKSISQEFRAEEHGWEINYLVEATRFTWLRKRCTGSRRHAGVHHKQHRLDWERNARTNRFHKQWLIQLTSVKFDLIQESQKRRWLGGEEFRDLKIIKNQQDVSSLSGKHNHPKNSIKKAERCQCPK